MARNLNNPAMHCDYGATSSTRSSAITSRPDVNFSGFSPTDYMSLSDYIAFNIISVNSSWKQLDKALKVIGTAQDTRASRDKVHHLQSQTNIRIETTSKDLQRLTAVVSRVDKQQKLKLQKLTSEFGQVVEKYSESQQKIAAAMKKVVLHESVHRLSQQQDEESANQDLIQRQIQSDENQRFEQNVLLDRERQFKEIEAIVLDVHSIFQTLSSLVEKQKQQVDSVGDSVDNTNNQIEMGADDLRKATEYRASNRRRILILLAIAVIIGLIVTGVIVGKLSS